MTRRREHPFRFACEPLLHCVVSCRAVCCHVQVPMEALFPDANPLALDLLGKMLEFDQNRRLSVDGALSHPYLLELHSKAKVCAVSCRRQLPCAHGC